MPENAMERLRRRLNDLLDERSSAGNLRQKRLAEFFTRVDGKPRSEAWIANILSGQRGLRLVDLDKLAEFFRLPPSEFVREFDNNLVEVTPTELALLRRFRRLTPEEQQAVQTMMRIQTDAPSKPSSQKRTIGTEKK